MDKTYMKVKGVWMNLYRAADKECNTVEFLLTKRRNKRAALPDAAEPLLEPPGTSNTYTQIKL